MIMGLKSRPFSDNLCKKPPTTLDELRARIVDFIQMEEMATFIAQMRGKPLKKQVA